MNVNIINVNPTNLAYEFCTAHSDNHYPRPKLCEGAAYDCNVEKIGNTTIEGVLQLNNYRQINNTKYVIDRHFGNQKTPEQLITERVMNSKPQYIPVVSTPQAVYTEPGDSVKQ